MWGDMQSKTKMMEAPLPPPADPLFIGLRRRIDPEKKELLGGGLEPPRLTAYAPQTYVSAIPPPELGTMKTLTLTTQSLQAKTAAKTTELIGASSELFSSNSCRNKWFEREAEYQRHPSRQSIYYLALETPNAHPGKKSVKWRILSYGTPLASIVKV